MATRISGVVMSRVAMRGSQQIRIPDSRSGKHMRRVHEPVRLVGGEDHALLVPRLVRVVRVLVVAEQVGPPDGLRVGVEGVDGRVRELQCHVDILLGRVEPPIDAGVMTLMELAEAYHARAKEMEMEIHDAERQGAVTRGSGAYKFRTGKLRSFTELASKTIELGSRRVTYQQYLMREREGR